MVFVGVTKHEFLACGVSVRFDALLLSRHLISISHSEYSDRLLNTKEIIEDI